MSNDEKKIKGGYHYTVSDDHIRKFSKIPLIEQLRWLEETQDFLDKVMTPKEKEILQKFRRGEI